MRLRLQDLPPDRVRLLTDPPAGTWRQVHPRRWLGVLGVLTLGCGLAAAWCLGSGFAGWDRPWDAWLPWIGLLGLGYGLVALVEYARVLAGSVRPCLLLTPFDLVRCAGAHRPLDVHRLAHAKAFHRTEEYSGRAWTGLGYTFTFDSGEKVHFSLRRKEDIEAADRVLALAQLAGRGEPLPDLPGCRLGSLDPGAFLPVPMPGFLAKVLDPASEFWLLVLGVLILAFIPYAIFR